MLNSNLESYYSRNKNSNLNQRNNIKPKKYEKITSEKVFYENENMNEQFRLVSEIDNEDIKSNKKFPKPDTNKESNMNGNKSNFKKNPSEEFAQSEKSSFRLQ